MSGFIGVFDTTGCGVKQHSGGAGGIRTLDRALQPYNGLANRRLQPLGHSSVKADMPEAGGSRKQEIPGCLTRSHLVTPWIVIEVLERVVELAPRIIRRVVSLEIRRVASLEFPRSRCWAISETIAAQNPSPPGVMHQQSVAGGKIEIAFRPKK